MPASETPGATIPCLYCDKPRTVGQTCIHCHAPWEAPADPARSHPSHQWIEDRAQTRCRRCGAYRHLSSGFEPCSQPLPPDPATAITPPATPRHLGQPDEPPDAADVLGEVRPASLVPVPHLCDVCGIRHYAGGEVCPYCSSPIVTPESAAHAELARQLAGCREALKAAKAFGSQGETHEGVSVSYLIDCALGGR